MRWLGLPGAVLGTLCISSMAFAQVDSEGGAPPVRLGPIPTIQLSSPPPAFPTSEEIERLIEDLAKIDSPDFGISATLAGAAFSPLDQLNRVFASMITDHGFARSDTLSKLVAIGPSALPHLLNALDNETPTKLTIEHKWHMGMMWLDREMHSNPVNPVERRVIAKLRPVDEFAPEHRAVKYVVKLGDVCFLAIGQIVGRDYCAVRYQPTACIVINSPVEDAQLAAAVRELWGQNDPRKLLFESLLTNYSTQGVFNGESLDGWSVGSDLQCGAATRLLYYYPNEAAALIAGRLDAMNVTRVGPPSSKPSNPKELEAFVNREVSNGVRTDDFIRAVAWCREPVIVEALDSIHMRTKDADVLRIIREAKSNE